MVEERITKLEVSMAEMGSDLKHILKTLDDIKYEFRQVATNHERVIQVEAKLNQIETQFREYKKQTTTPIKSSIAGAGSSIIILGLIEIIKLIL